MKNFFIALGIFLLSLLIMASTFAAGFVVGRTASVPEWLSVVLKPAVKESSITQYPPVIAENTGTPKDLQTLFEPFWESWNLVKELFVDQPVNQELMMRGAISGMLQSLGDPHTSFLDPEMFRATNAHLDGEEYEGIGAWVDITGDYLKIISPMPGSPAEKSGLRPGDIVIAIDGVDMTGFDGEAVRQRILGPRGSTVILTIQRKGVTELLEISVIRDAIVVPSLTGKILDSDIAYVELFTFGDSTSSELKELLKELLKKNPKGLILDLRNNGGGYLNTAIAVASEFLDKGVVLYEEYGDGTMEKLEVKPGGLATKIPMVILINEGSASASEIVAGAVQDRGRGYLVGVTSFGKGSVQTITQLKHDQGAVRITVARWLTPSKRQINGVGLTPDFLIEMSEADFAEEKDPQLEMAVKVLLERLVPQPTSIPSAAPITPAVP